MDRTYLVCGDKEYAYSELLNRINDEREYGRYLYVKGNDPVHVFFYLLHSLVYQYDIEILDGDFSELELQQLGVDRSDLFRKQQVEQSVRLETFANLLQRIEQHKDWTVTLYTSGTTGRPKKVSHSLSTITRNVKKAEAFKHQVWAFAYNPTHIAGLQVFFQAIMNQNTIIYTFDGQRKNLESYVRKYRITNISATSTYYRTVLPYFTGSYDCMRYVTFGGEKFDSRLTDTIRRIFPQASIRNIYASTEAGSLFSGKGELFEIREDQSHLIKISPDSKLLIHRSLLGQSETFDLDGEWFHTGDIVEIVDQRFIRFLSRESDFVNVGGYKVNPSEVEEALLETPGVVDLVVKPVKNPITGYILTAEVVLKDDKEPKEMKKLIKQYASERLQEWKVPRIITIVSEIERNRAGKKMRQ